MSANKRSETVSDNIFLFMLNGEASDIHVI